MTIEEISALITERNRLLRERQKLLGFTAVSVYVAAEEPLRLDEEETRQVVRLLTQNRIAAGRQVDIQLRAGGIDVPIETAS
jgi:hypothetical protein